jgi:hypothetical protein
MNRIAFISILFIVALLSCKRAPSSTHAAVVSSSSPAQLVSPTTDDDPSKLQNTPVTPTPNPSWYGQGPLAPRSHTLYAASAGSFPPPVYQASWATTDWWIDPVNGLDTNTCTTIGSPCLTYAQIAARWGTYSPRLRQVTTIHLINSQSGNTDPIIARPFAENTGALIVKCELPSTPLQTGTLTNIISKNRATPQLLNATIGAGGAAGQLIVNTTHPSRAFLYTNSGGNAWNITQPLAPLTPPLGGSETEVDTWANGDVFSVYALTRAFVADLEVLQVDGNASFGPVGYIWQCGTLAPDSTNVMQLAYGTDMVESTGASFVAITNGPLEYATTFVNAYMPVTIAATAEGFFTNVFAPEIFVRGGLAWQVARGAWAARSDVILAYPSSSGPAGMYLNLAYIASGMTVDVTGISSVVGPVWGPGTINVMGSGRLTYPSGNAVGNFLQTGGLKINGGVTGCSHSNAAPDVVDCGIALSPVNLDAAQSTTGFGGLAYVPGGGSISSGGL